MFRLLVACTLLAVASPAFADEKDKPKQHTLTPKEIADGWILLFDGESTFGWKIDGPSQVKNGVWHLGGGPKVAQARLATRFADFDAVIEADGSDGVGDLVFDGDGEAKSGLWGQPMALD